MQGRTGSQYATCLTLLRHTCLPWREAACAVQCCLVKTAASFKQAHVTAALLHAQAGQAYNLSAEVITGKDIAQAIASALGLPEACSVSLETNKQARLPAAFAKAEAFEHVAALRQKLHAS